MVRPLTIVFSPRAKQDLEEIWDASVARWGIDRTVLYFEDLRRTLEMLAHGQRLARSREAVRPGLLSYPSGSHEVFFRIRSDTLDVVRILYARMDFKRHL